MYPREQSSEQSNYAAGQGKARLVSPRVFYDNLKLQCNIAQTRTPETLHNHWQESRDDIPSNGDDSRGRIRTRSERPQTYYNEDLRRTSSIEPSDKVEYALPERKIELKGESLPKHRYRRHRYRRRIIDDGSN